MEKTDRRIRKTKKAIEEAFISLLEEKELSRISVKELCEAADIHRATFYAHYLDIYDLYDKVEREVMEEIGAILVNDESHSYDGLYRLLVDYVEKNASLYRLLSSSDKGPSFDRKLTRLMEERYLSIWLYEDERAEVSEDMRFLTSYNIGGCAAIIKRWVDSGLSYPKEKVITLLKIANDGFDAMTQESV